MLETPHVAVGAAIAISISNPLIALPLCLASHFLLDKIPHWNPHTYTETQKFGYPTKKTLSIAAADITLASSLGLFVAGQALPDVGKVLFIIICCFLSVLPDVVKYPFFLFKNLRKGILKKWVDYERTLQVDTTFIPGILTQITTIILSLFVIYH